MFWRRRRRLDEEVASHLAEETADNIERGMTPAAARNAALRAFGNVEAAKERARERDPFYWFDTVCQDVRFAFRLIARNPWLSVTIVATLTVGIGLNVSVFSLLNGFFLQPWVGTEPDTFIGLHPRYSGRVPARILRRRHHAARLRQVSRFREIAGRPGRVSSREPDAQRRRVRPHSRRPDFLQHGRRHQAGATGPRPLPHVRRLRDDASSGGGGSERVDVAHSIQRRHHHRRADHPSQSRPVHRRRRGAEPRPGRGQRATAKCGCLTRCSDSYARPPEYFADPRCAVADGRGPAAAGIPASAGAGGAEHSCAFRGRRRARSADVSHRHRRIVDTGS